MSRTPTLSRRPRGHLVPKLCRSQFKQRRRVSVARIRRRRSTAQPRVSTAARPLKGFHNTGVRCLLVNWRLFNPVRVGRFVRWSSQGALTSFATLGCDVERLRRKTQTSHDIGSPNGERLKLRFQPRSQTPFGDALPRNSVSRAAKQSFAGQVFPSRSLGTS